MSVSSNKSSNSQMNPIIIGIAVLALLAFVGWRAWATFAPPYSPPIPSGPSKTKIFLQAKAKECQGDIRKLSPADQQAVQDASHGMGEASMATEYRNASQPTPSR